MKFYQKTKKQIFRIKIGKITSDGENFYIGDFGNNNAGNRRDLAVYKLIFKEFYSKIPLIILQPRRFFLRDIFYNYDTEAMIFRKW